MFHVECFVHSLVQARSVSQNAAEISQRKTKLESISQDVTTAFSSKLSAIASERRPWGPKAFKESDLPQEFESP